MLKPIIEHQKEINDIYEKMKFLRDNFNIENQDAFYEELTDLVKEIRSEIDYHFNLQFHSITNEKAKKFVMENKLVRDMLFRMLDYIKAKCVEKSMDAFLKFDDFDGVINTPVPYRSTEVELGTKRTHIRVVSYGVDAILFGSLNRS
jgi:hypothetical protein